MKQNITLSLKDWCDLFGTINKELPYIFWMTRLNHQSQKYEQVYLNDQYENIVGHCRSHLFNDNHVFSSYINSNNKNELIKHWYQRHFDGDTEGTIVFSISKSDGSSAWLRDSYYTIYDKHNTPAYAAGIVIDISQQMGNFNDKLENQYKRLQHEAYIAHADALYEKLQCKLSIDSPSDIIKPVSAVTLSKRENQCAELLVNGLTSKEIATKLCISPRTVEVYIDRLKNRLKAKNKVHLVKRLYEEALM